MGRGGRCRPRPDIDGDVGGAALSGELAIGNETDGLIRGFGGAVLVREQAGAGPCPLVRKALVFGALKRRREVELTL